MSNAIKTIKIGKVHLKNNLFLAPLLGFTNFAFREGIQKTSPISVFTEMISINALSKDSNYCKDQIRRGIEEKNVFYQFFGNDEDKTVKSIQNTLDAGIKIDFFNLNCGCPAQDIVKQGAGSALLKRESKINSIIKAVKDNFDIPVTIKIRSGYDVPKHLDYNKLEESGCDAIFIHSRTRKQQYSGKIDLEFLKKAKESTVIPVIANGDLKNKEDIINIHNEINCDGYMLGRQALVNPFIFEEILYDKQRLFDDKVKFLEEYYQKLKDNGVIDVYGCIKPLGIFLTHGLIDATSLRVKLSEIKSAELIIDTLKKVK
jgi:nifR3 family TIM-barrel protein